MEATRALVRGALAEELSDQGQGNEPFLHLALRRHQGRTALEVCEALLAAPGLARDARDASGSTALDVARALGHAAVVDLLLRDGESRAAGGH